MNLRLFCRVLGAAAVLGAAIALSSPLGLDAVAREGRTILCGTAFRADVELAEREDALNRRLHIERGAPFLASDYTAQCQALLDGRRMVAASVAGTGMAIAVASLYRRPRRGTHASPTGFSNRRIEHRRRRMPAKAPGLWSPAANNSEKTSYGALFDSAGKTLHH